MCTDSGTYIEDLKDPIEVQFPSSNLLFVVLCMEKLRADIPPTLLDDPLLDFRHSSTLEVLVGNSERTLLN